MSNGLSKLEEHLLILVEKQEMYGTQFINAYSNAGKNLKPGSLYPTLERLENQELVAWRWGDEQSGPRRKYYRITDAGLAALEAERKFRERLREKQ